MQEKEQHPIVIEELTIGDYIKDAHNNKIIRWSQEDYFVRGSNGYVTPMRISGRDIEPIPLTSHILELIGFDKIPQTGVAEPYHWQFTQTDDDMFETYAISAYNNIWNGMRIEIDNYVSDEHVDIQLKYLHEFQQILRICGTDFVIYGLEEKL